MTGHWKSGTGGKTGRGEEAGGRGGQAGGGQGGGDKLQILRALTPTILESKQK